MIQLFTLLWASVSAFAAVQTAKVEIKDLVLDKHYEAMEGPNVHVPFPLPPNARSAYMILGGKIEIISDGKPAPELLCHSRLGFARKDTDLKKLNMIHRNDEMDMRNLIAISQGLAEVDFPEGFGLPVRLEEEKNLLFGIQIQGSAHEGKPRKVQVSSSLRYMNMGDAVRAGIKPLNTYRMAISVDHDKMVHGGHNPNHFAVPPGRHVFEKEISIKRKTLIHGKVVRIHYMRVHLHAYGESLELREAATNKVLWRANARTDLKTGALSYADHYSSVEGLPLDGNKKYKLVATYNNPTNKMAEGMALIAMYFR